MPTPFRPNYFTLVAEPQNANLSISPRHSDTSSYQYRINNGSWNTVTSSGNNLATRRITGLSAETAYNIDVRSRSRDNQSSELMSLSFRTPTNASSRLPIWRNTYVVAQSGSSLILNLSNSVINESAGAGGIENTYGLRKYMSFSGTRLAISNIPLVSNDKTIVSKFRATNTLGTSLGTLNIKIIANKNSYLSKSLYMVHRGGVEYENGNTAGSLGIDSSGGLDFIALVSQNISRYSVTNANGFSNRDIPDTVGQNKSTTFDGLQYDLVPLDRQITGRVNFSFTGTGRRVYAIHLLKLGFVIDANREYTEIVPGMIDRTGGIHEETKGGISRYPSLGRSRHKYKIDYTAVFENANTHEDLIYWAENNLNFFHIEEYTQRPQRMYHATWGAIDFNSQYISRFREVGNTLSFRIEQR